MNNELRMNLSDVGTRLRLLLSTDLNSIYFFLNFVLCITVENSLRKNNPLCHETIRWRSDVPLTQGQLRSKRDEFWETAPAFDGRREIWDALKAASRAAESLDFVLAQAILDGANVSVPNG